MVSSPSIQIDLSGKVALVTGGTRGIGKAISEALFAANAKVIVTGTKIEEIAQLNANDTSGRLVYVQVDFLDEVSVSNFLKYIHEQSVIDILINNAGVNRVNYNTETNSEDFDVLNSINLKAPYLVSREVSKLMKQNGYGRIVNVTSIWSVITRPGRSLYSLTKWGIVGLTKTLAVELAEHNILVNSIAPGFTMTELTASTNTPEEIEKITNLIPAKRMAQPVEIATTVLFLCSNLNTYLTGQNIVIDGGYTNV